MTSSAANPPTAAIEAFARRFDVRLAALLPTDVDTPAVLREAVEYALLGSGKRLRPYLVTQVCTLVGGTEEDAVRPAAALEMVHAFSLVHDDLPAMDDDDLRRGRPTVHRRFSEAVAILAGDALLALAFETLASAAHEPQRVKAMIAQLARAAGWCGMIGGQVADVVGEDRPQEIELVRYVHHRKTAALFEAACRMGAIAGGAGDAQIATLGHFGRETGLAFQIADDLLDLTATAAELGKGVGKDVAHRKQTYPACVGTEESRTLASASVRRAVEALDDFGKEADCLRALARFCVERTY